MSLRIAKCTILRETWPKAALEALALVVNDGNSRGVESGDGGSEADSASEIRRSTLGHVRTDTCKIAGLFVGKVDTGKSHHGIDISGNRQNPCRNDKSLRVITFRAD